WPSATHFAVARRAVGAPPVACAATVTRVECGHPLSDLNLDRRKEKTMRIRIALRSLALTLITLTLSTVAAPAIKKGDEAGRLDRLARSVTIYRDSYGVPHIFGPTDASCVYGYAYAQAEDNFWQIEDSYIRALGRAAEVYGPRTLADDLLNHALEIPRLAKAEYDRSNARMKELCQAVADGFNYYLARNPQTKPRLITHFE